MKKLKIGISACLMGLKFRYDGKSKMDQRIIDALAGKVDLIPVCPEVECGMSIPRPKIRLEMTQKGVRAKVIDTGEDKTDEITSWAVDKLEQLCDKDVAAFLFKSGSPSCGLCSSKIFDPSGKLVSEKGSGIFAKLLRRRFPEMIVGQELELEEFCRKVLVDVPPRNGKDGK